ncbi:MAG: DegT/DnrJ/EryC1/StrS family aminotransferase [Bacteroidetes bacterium]|nr:DegT/DnrJ/EryC1/StrS family aminotransferase [Bacteroidota bacterium]
MSTIPFFSLQHLHRSIQRELSHAFSNVIKQGRFILDREVELFEKEFAGYHRTKYCVTVGNGHDALLISLKALGIGKGDEVIVPSHTFMATWLAVVNAGAVPVPVEVDPITYTLNPDLIRHHLSRKVKAILSVHLYGHPCEMDTINSIAKKNNLFVVEDNAQAHGAVFKNKRTGSWGDCNATSFYPTKNLGALGDGGAILTHHKTQFDFAKTFRNYGTLTKNVYASEGINSRLDELQAAILRVKLKHLDKTNEARKKNARIYFELLKDVGDVVLPPSENKFAQPVYHQFVIQTAYRDKLRNFLEKKGIETVIHYPMPIHLQPAFAHLRLKKGSLPAAEKISKQILSLPIWPGLKPGEIEFVAKTIRTFYL